MTSHRNVTGLVFVMAVYCLLFCGVGAWAAPGQKEIVFIDAAVEDIQVLLKGIRPDVEVVRLEAWRDGVRQMAEVLARRQGLDAVHVISHGTAGKLSLGAVEFSAQNMADYDEQMKVIGASLREGGCILVYGSNVAKGVEGRHFLEQLAQSTRVNLAASTDATGSAALGGDWHLEARTGTIPRDALALGQSFKRYEHLLATCCRAGEDLVTMQNSWEWK